MPVPPIGGMISDLFGSDAPPKAILNRYAAPTATASGTLSTDLANDANSLSKQALQYYMGGQGQMEQLAGQQASILKDIQARRMAADPNALLGQVGHTAFSFIDPNVINPLAQFDVNSQNLQRRAHGLNPAALDSTANRLRDARIASGRYYDVAKDAYAALPGLYNQAYGQGQANEATAASINPQIAATYEQVRSRPSVGIANRINTASGAQNVASQGIRNILDATQGYQQPRNFADRLGAAGSRMEASANQTLNEIGQMAGQAASNL